MRRESPIKRRNPSGEIVWVARYTGRDGKHRIAKPSWNRGKGTFRRKADAQKAIDEAYGLSDRPDTLGDYAATWTERHPRSERTNATNDHRISRVADVEIEGIPLKDWPLRELRRRHTLVLVDHMLRTEGRATTGAVGILRALSAMAEARSPMKSATSTPSRASASGRTTQGLRRNRGRSASSPSRKCTASRKRQGATRQWSASSPTAA
jgi:hypothetical protein